MSALEYATREYDEPHVTIKSSHSPSSSRSTKRCSASARSEFVLLVTGLNLCGGCVGGWVGGRQTEAGPRSHVSEMMKGVGGMICGWSE